MTFPQQNTSTSAPAATLLCVGLGSPHGDDQFGWCVADALEAHVGDIPGVRIRKAASPIDLLDWLDGVAELCVCDAVENCGSSAAGTRFEARCNGRQRQGILPELRRMRAASSHQIGLPAVLDLADRLERMPRRLVVIGVVGREFRPGSALSAEVLAAVPEIARSVGQEWKERNARAVAGAVAAQSG